MFVDRDSVLCFDDKPPLDKPSVLTKDLWELDERFPGIGKAAMWLGRNGFCYPYRKSNMQKILHGFLNRSEGMREQRRHGIPFSFKSQQTSRWLRQQPTRIRNKPARR